MGQVLHASAATTHAIRAAIQRSKATATELAERHRINLKTVAFAQLLEKATRAVAADFLRALIAAVPYKIHTVLTDTGTHFTTPGNICSMAQELKWQEASFSGPTPSKHPWTNGQVERRDFSTCSAAHPT